MTEWESERYGNRTAASLIAEALNDYASDLIDARPPDAPPVSVVALVQTRDADGDMVGSMVVSSNDARAAHPAFAARVLSEGQQTALRMLWAQFEVETEHGDTVHIPWEVDDDQG